jgi:hypothetical protein
MPWIGRPFLWPPNEPCPGTFLPTARFRSNQGQTLSFRKNSCTLFKVMPCATACCAKWPTIEMRTSASTGWSRATTQTFADGFGRLVHRIFTLLGQYSDGRIPARPLLVFDQTIEVATAEIRAEARFLFNNNNFSEGLKKIRSLLAIMDKALTDNPPDGITDHADHQPCLTAVLYDACQGLGLIMLLLQPVLPRSSEAIWKSLAQTTRLEDQLIDETPWGFLVPGTPTARPEEFFPRLAPSGKLQPSVPNDGRSEAAAVLRKPQSTGRILGAHKPAAWNSTQRY